MSTPNCFNRAHSTSRSSLANTSPRTEPAFIFSNQLTKVKVVPVLSPSLTVIQSCQPPRRRAPRRSVRSRAFRCRSVWHAVDRRRELRRLQCFSESWGLTPQSGAGRAGSPNPGVRVGSVTLSRAEMTPRVRRELPARVGPRIMPSRCRTAAAKESLGRPL